MADKVRSAQNVCVSSVTDEARAVLEEFLKHSLGEETSPLKNFYQGLTELDVIEEATPPSQKRFVTYNNTRNLTDSVQDGHQSQEHDSDRSTPPLPNPDLLSARRRTYSYRQASQDSVLDERPASGGSIRYIDEEDEDIEEDGRCESLKDCRRHHIDHGLLPLKKAHTVSSSSYGQIMREKYKPSSQSSSVADNLEHVGVQKEEDTVKYPIISPSELSDTAISQDSGYRTKKTMFKRTKERLRESFKRVKDKKPKSSASSEMSKSESFNQRMQKKKEKKEKNKVRFNKMFGFTRKGTKKDEGESESSKSYHTVTPGSTTSSMRATTPSMATSNRLVAYSADQEIIMEKHSHKHSHVRQETVKPNGHIEGSTVQWGGGLSAADRHKLLLHTQETEEIVDITDQHGYIHRETKLNTKESYPEKKDKNIFDNVLKNIRRRGSIIKRRLSISKGDSPKIRDDRSRLRGSTHSAEDLLDDTQVEPHARKHGRHERCLTLPAKLHHKTSIDETILDQTKHLHVHIHDQVIADNADLDDIDGVYMGHIQQKAKSENNNQDTIRSKLKLDLDMIHSPKLLGNSKDYDITYDYDVTETRIKRPSGQQKVVKQEVETQRTNTLSSSVEADGRSPEPSSITSLPFDKKSDKEKDELYGKIADKLAHIADNYSAKDHESAASELDTPSVDRTSSLERKIADCLRNHGDKFSKNMENPTSALNSIILNSSYKNFSQVVKNYIGDEPVVNQIALLFHVCKSGIQRVGQGGAMAVQIKEMSLRYFADSLAGWVVGKGGWDSMIETSTDSELD